MMLVAINSSVSTDENFSLAAGSYISFSSDSCIRRGYNLLLYESNSTENLNQTAWYFIVPGLITLVIVLITSGYHE